MRDAEYRPQRILVAEDNQYTLDVVKKTLTRAGFDVVTAENGEEALQLIERYGMPHLALIDILMPGMDGISFCRAIHEYTDLPIIMLTALDDEDVIVDAIDRFAEDYIVKPFKPRELVARVNRVLRRIGDFGYTLDPVIAVDEGLQVEFAKRRIIVDGEEGTLTPTESRILFILMRNAGRIVTSEFLMRRIWPLEEVHENRLRVHVHNLRQKVERDPAKPVYVLSERGIGYRFAGPAR